MTLEDFHERCLYTESKEEEPQSIADLVDAAELGNRDERYFHRLRRYEILGRYYQHRRNDIRIFDFDTSNVIAMHQQLHKEHEPWIPICIHNNVRGNLKRDFTENFDPRHQPKVGEERILWIEAINERAIHQQKEERHVVDFTVILKIRPN